MTFLTHFHKDVILLSLWLKWGGGIQDFLNASIDFVWAVYIGFVLWIADRVVNNENVSGSDQWCAKRRRTELSAGLSFFFLWSDDLARCLIQGRNLSSFSANHEDENAERSESIFIWHDNRRQPLTEWRLTWPDSSSMRKWSSATTFLFIPPSLSFSLSFTHTAAFSLSLYHNRPRFSAQAFRSTGLRETI